MSEKIKTQQTPQEQPLDVNFSHRLSPLLNDHSVAYLVDTIEQMTARASAMLLVFEAHIERNEENFNPEILGRLVESVMLEIVDIQEVTRAHYSAYLAVKELNKVVPEAKL